MGNVKFINITEADFLSKKLLFKFMPLEYALNTLKGHHLWFANPCTWLDPFEKRFIENKYIIGGTEKDYPWKGRVFCMCMTEKSTSEAYWNTYANNDIGVSFKFKRKELLNSLKNYARTTNSMVFIGKVVYQKTNVITGKIADNPFLLNDDGSKIASLGAMETKARLLLLKREAFHYEEEIRFFIVKQKVTKERGFYFDYVTPNVDIIDGLTLDPRLGELTTELLKDVFSHNYGFMPVNKRVQKSLLYAQRNAEKIKL